MHRLSHRNLRVRAASVHLPPNQDPLAWGAYEINRGIRRRAANHVLLVVLRHSFTFEWPTPPGRSAAEAIDATILIISCARALIWKFDPLFLCCRTELVQSPGLNLPHTFLGDSHLGPHLFECLRLLAMVKAEAANDNLLLAVVKP